MTAKQTSKRSSDRIVPDALKGCLSPTSAASGMVAADELRTWAAVIDQVKGDFLGLAEAMEGVSGKEVEVRGWTKASRGYKLLMQFIDNTETAIFRARQAERRGQR